MAIFSDDPVLRGLHFDGYNYGVKNPEKTRYGCIKKKCSVKLLINASHDPKTIKIVGQHSCYKSTHQSLAKRLLRVALKDKASSAPPKTDPKDIFDAVCKEKKSLASSATDASFSKLKKTIQRALDEKQKKFDSS